MRMTSSSSLKLENPNFFLSLSFILKAQPRKQIADCSDKKKHKENYKVVRKYLHVFEYKSNQTHNQGQMTDITIQIDIFIQFLITPHQLIDSRFKKFIASTIVVENSSEW